MFDTLRAIAAYVFDLGVLIFFHELGHYLAARSQGVVVEAFSIGFGPAILSHRASSGTVWKLCVLPLGGYVKMQGWGTSEAAEVAKPGSFSAASLPSKALIVAAGPAANIILAFVIFLGLFVSVGQTIVKPVISSVQPGSPAEAAGLKAGDQIMSAADIKINDFMQLQGILAKLPDATLKLIIQRGQTEVTKSVTLGDTLQAGQKVGRLGIVGSETAQIPRSPQAALRDAVVETYNDTVAVVQGLYRLAVYHQGVKDLAGPLGIAQISGKVASLGFVSVLDLIAVLSINLGIINLVPIPILDGGHLVYYTIEGIIRRPLPLAVREFGLRFGLAVIASLFLLTTINDLTRLGALRWMAHLF